MAGGPVSWEKAEDPEGGPVSWFTRFVRWLQALIALLTGRKR